MAKLSANNGDPDQTPRSVASDMGLHCLPFTIMGVSRLQWVKVFLASKGPTFFRIFTYIVFVEDSLGKEIEVGLLP